MRLGLFFAALAWAGANHVSAQTIQLPSFSSFSVDTTVVVPDSGRAPAAGTRRASSGTSTFGGFPRQRASGSNWQAARIHVLAKIHDPAEADRALLDQALAGRAPSPDPAVTLKPDVTPAATEPGLASVAQIERQRIAQSVARQREAFTLYEKGRQAQAAGKPGVAAVYFRTAASRATGTLKQEIDADLRSLKSPVASARSLDTTPTAK